MNDNPNGQNASDNETTYPLDDVAIEMLNDLDRQAAQLDAARMSVLTYFAKQHKLGDGWQLAQNRRELVRMTPEQMQAAQRAAQTPARSVQ